MATKEMKKLRRIRLELGCDQYGNVPKNRESEYISYKLKAAADRLDRLLHPPKPKPPMASSVDYKKPKRTKLGYFCRQCGKPKSDYSPNPNGVCNGCYKQNCRDKYEIELKIWEAKIEYLKKVLPP